MIKCILFSFILALLVINASHFEAGDPFGEHIFCIEFLNDLDCEITNVAEVSGTIPPELRENCKWTDDGCVSTSNPPSFSPTNAPSDNPSLHPSARPSLYPTSNPSLYPTSNPSLYPTNAPSCAIGSANNWYIENVGKSTQFKLYDPCNDKIFIKIKMQDITEYSGADDTKTNNKEPSFAGTKWDWDTASGSVFQFQGNSVLANFYRSTLSKKAGDYAQFKLSTYLFFNAGTILKLGETVATVVAKNSIKFSMQIDNWKYLDPSNYLVMCINIMSNGGSVTTAGSTTYYLEGFKFVTDDKALCDDKEIDVTTKQIRGKNNFDLCFTFEPCDGGNIFYDPTVTYEGVAYEDKAGWIHTSWVMVTFANIFIGTFLLL